MAWSVSLYVYSKRDLLSRKIFSKNRWVLGNACYLLRHTCVLAVSSFSFPEWKSHFCKHQWLYSSARIFESTIESCKPEAAPICLISSSQRCIVLMLTCVNHEDFSKQTNSQRRQSWGQYTALIVNRQCWLVRHHIVQSVGTIKGLDVGCQLKFVQFQCLLKIYLVCVLSVVCKDCREKSVSALRTICILPFN